MDGGAPRLACGQSYAPCPRLLILVSSTLKSDGRATNFYCTGLGRIGGGRHRVWWNFYIY